jgi:hypothetical protein
MMKRTVFGEDEKYRYLIETTWNSQKSVCTFILLNPAIKSDGGVITRCQKYAESFNCGSLNVVNLFAYRTKDPAFLLTAKDPIGPENSHYIRTAIKNSFRSNGPVICAWGDLGTFKNQDQIVLKWIKDIGAVPMCLGKTKQGNPSHPLRLPKNRQPVILEQK